MSKRGAEEYITKEHGSTPNDASEGARVKMATAAQLAKRKMAVPKSRAGGRSGQSPLPGAGSSNPFATNNAFGSVQNSQTQTFPNSGGITFGASQSFPPGDSTSSTGFNFSIPGQSTSFTFGQSTPNNPFAGTNGTTNGQTQVAQDSNDITMESPQKKPALGAGSFGMNNHNDNTPVSTGFAFGQSTNQAPNSSGFSFGQSQSFGGSPSTTLFGQAPSKSPEPTTSNLFGQSVQPQNNATTSTSFGSSQGATQQKQPTSFNFGQPAASTSSLSSGLKFGEQPASATPSTTTFGFGQSPQAQTPSNMFGGFGQSSQAPIGSSTTTSQPASSSSLFGAPSTASAPSAFAGFGTSKPAEPEQKQSALLGKPAPTPVKDQNILSESATEDKSKANPFAGLFAKPTPNQTETGTTSAASGSKPLFDFGKPASSSTLFSPQKASEADPAPKVSAPSPSKALFNFGTPAASPAPISSSPPKQSTASSANMNPFGGFASQAIKSVESKPAQSLFGSTKEQPTTNGTGFKPSSTSDSTTGPTNFAKPSPTPNTVSSNMFGGFSKSEPSRSFDAPSSSSKDSESSKQRQSNTFFGNNGITNAAEPQKSTPDLFTTTVSATATTVTATPTEIQEHETSGPSQRSVNTNPPLRIPPYLNGDDYKSYDSNYRLHSLNREFQKRIASLDPSRIDFENILRNYVAARESIGESIGLYTRNVAGMKRKVDEEDDRRDSAESSAKRSKPTQDAPSEPVLSVKQPSNAVFQSVPSSTPKSTTTSFTPTASKTSSLFSSMIPNSTNSAPVQPPSHPFANLGKSVSSTNTESASNPFAKLGDPVPSTKTDSISNPTFSFGSSTKTPSVPVPSTTPTKSPPKKSGLQMPAFNAPAGGVNFMDAFKKQSQESSAQLAKKAKEKRKAEEFDSDEDDEEEWERKYEEEERAKKAKVAAVAFKGFTPTFGSGTASPAEPSTSFGVSSSGSSSTPKPAAPSLFSKQPPAAQSDRAISISDNDASVEDDDEEGSGDQENGEEEDDEDEEEAVADEDDLPEDDVDEEEDDDEDDVETALAKSRSKGKSLFDRVAPNPNLQKTSTPLSAPIQSIEKEKAPSQKPSMFSNKFGKSTSDAPSFSPLTPTSASKPYVPSTTFDFTAPPRTVTPTPVAGASIFAGGAIKEGPITGEGLFGSRPSTPSNTEKPKGIFSNLGTPSFGFGGDHTWKQGNEIKFSTSTAEAPSVSITEPTPRKQENKPFANLFGSTSSGNHPATENGTGFMFSQSPAPGYLSAASHLTGGSGTNSGLSSRATSPGTTDNESVATNEEDYSNDTQVSLMEARPGEENEDVILEARAKLMRHYNQQQIDGTKFINGWNGIGLGTARLLKHRETGKTRLVMRAEPGANVILNTNLQPEANYDYASAQSAGTVKFNVFTNDGVAGYVLKVKTQQLGKELAKAMEENKGSKS